MGEDIRAHKNFGSRVFNKDSMAQYLSKPAFKEMVEVFEGNNKLTPELADQVAHAMKEWALDHGATHFTHWFQPMRGVTAEKHDSFINVDDGQVIERFSGYQLIQSEPDASSFPSGGMRSTFEARGYTGWDPTSPAFLLIGHKRCTLVIPSVYFSFTGEVLDLKRPLLRSLAYLERVAFQMIKRFGNRTARNVKVTVGAEQEFFLIDKNYFQNRLDLLLCGRTLLGAPSPRLQQLEDHYFGAIKPKILSFMEDVDENLSERGIPYKTRHNEVAPNQFEFAPLFSDANLAVDHNLQLMEIMRHVADDHGFALLLHEKPFAGVNGSGKHLNWSLQDSDGNNLLEPGLSPKKNIQFLVYLSAVLIGVKKYGHLLRAAVADAGNDHRLGANEAPPAIMSVFIGGYIRHALDSIAKGKGIQDLQSASSILKVRRLPGVVADASDRNRTSPVAFTGKKFEFRAVGSSQNVSEPTAVLSLLTAYGIERMMEKMDRLEKQFHNVRDAALAAVKEAVAETGEVCFEGNNYDEKWHQEAEKRGLPHHRNTPAALMAYLDPDVIELYTKNKILTKEEIHARVEVKLEAYIKTKILELNTLMEMVRTSVIPVLVRQLESYAKTASLLSDGPAKGILNGKIARLQTYFEQIEAGLATAERIAADALANGNLEKVAEMLAAEGSAVLSELRASCDKVEAEVDAQLWPLPKYTDMLHKI